MITINTAALAKAIKNLGKVRKRVSDDADTRYRAKIYYMAELAAKVSPQWSGDFASNWNLGINGSRPTYKKWAEKDAPGMNPRMNDNGTTTYTHYQAGDYAAVATSLGRIKNQLRGVTRKDKISLINATTMYTDGTNMIETDGIERLRPENLIPGRVRIESYVRARAKELA